MSGVVHFGIDVGLGPKHHPWCWVAREPFIAYACDCGAATFYTRHPMDKDGRLMTDEGRREFAEREAGAQKEKP